MCLSANLVALTHLGVIALNVVGLANILAGRWQVWRPTTLLNGLFLVTAWLAALNYVTGQPCWLNTLEARLRAPLAGAEQKAANPTSQQPNKPESLDPFLTRLIPILPAGISRHAVAGLIVGMTWALIEGRRSGVSKNWSG